jgi:hypothetical protein
VLICQEIQPRCFLRLGVIKSAHKCSTWSSLASSGQKDSLKQTVDSAVITNGLWSKISNESQWKKLPNLILSVGGSEKWINVNRLMGGIGDRALHYHRCRL